MCSALHCISYTLRPNRWGIQVITLGVVISALSYNKVEYQHNIIPIKFSWENTSAISADGEMLGSIPRVRGFAA